MFDSLISKMFGGSSFSKEQLSSHYHFLFSNSPSESILLKGIEYSKANPSFSLSEICSFMHKFDSINQSKIKAISLFKEKYKRNASSSEQKRICDSVESSYRTSNSDSILNISLLILLVSEAVSDDYITNSVSNITESYLSDSFSSSSKSSYSEDDSNSSALVVSASGTGSGSGSGSGCSGSGSGSGSGCSGCGS